MQEDKPADYLKITPLGGLGEIGLNCQIWESSQGLVLVDSGLMFPDDSQLGVDAVIPRFESFLAGTEPLLGVVLTHGHEDHIGSLPWLVPYFKNLPIYGSPFTLALVEHKLSERNLLHRVELHPMEPYSQVTLGNLSFKFLPVCHSIPQGYALSVSSPVGTVLHTGDFKLDLGEDCSLVQDLAQISQEQGIRLLLSDSTNSITPGHSRPEKEVRDSLRNIFANAAGRIVITLFSSHIARVRSVLELAEEFDRSVLISGRSLAANIEKAANLGLLDPPSNMHNDQEKLPDLPPEKTVVIATGTQGEPMSALTRIARGQHKQVSLQAGDTVIFSSRIIPGNAKAVSRMVNQLYRQGAEVYCDPRQAIHATGHACQDELRQVLEAARPEYFVPVHGEYRHLKEHADLAAASGVDKDKIMILEDGQPLILEKETCRRGEPVAVDFVLVDGKGVGDVGHMVLKDRRILGGEGLVVVILVLSEESGEVLHGPEVISRGFIFEQQYSHVLEESKCLILDHLERLQDPPVREEDYTQRLGDQIRSSLRRFFRDVLGRDPIVMPIISVV